MSLALNVHPFDIHKASKPGMKRAKLFLGRRGQPAYRKTSMKFNRTKCEHLRARIKCYYIKFVLFKYTVVILWLYEGVVFAERGGKREELSIGTDTV